MAKYGCLNHKLNIACLGCVKALSERHDRMLEFIRGIVKDWECDPNDAETVLKEIGKL